MKGPFFVKNKTEYNLADFCADCAFCGTRTKSCIMEKCPFMPDYEESYNDEDSHENKEEN